MSKLDIKKLKSVLKKIAVSDLKEGIETFEAIVDGDVRLSNEILMLSSRHNRLSREMTAGLITAENYNRELNRITYSFTAYADDIEEEDIEVSAIQDVKALKKYYSQIVLNDTPPAQTASASQQITPSPAPQGPVNIFISYAHKDEEYKDELNEHLSTLRRNGVIADWDDRQIQAGQLWDAEIKNAINKADYILLLISSSFFNSDYINDVEIKNAIDKHHKGEVIVIPIIIRPCDFSSSTLSRFQALPKGAKPISTWNDKDEAYLDVVNGLKGLFKR